MCRQAPSALKRSIHGKHLNETFKKRPYVPNGAMKMDDDLHNTILTTIP